MRLGPLEAAIPRTHDHDGASDERASHERDEEHERQQQHAHGPHAPHHGSARRVGLVAPLVLEERLERDLEFGDRRQGLPLPGLARDRRVSDELARLDALDEDARRHGPEQHIAVLEQPALGSVVVCLWVRRHDRIARRRRRLRALAPLPLLLPLQWRGARPRRHARSIASQADQREAPRSSSANRRGQRQSGGTVAGESGCRWGEPSRGSCPRGIRRYHRRSSHRRTGVGSPLNRKASRVSLLTRFGYDGSRFHGLQPQPDVPTAAGALRTRIEQAAGMPPRGMHCAARTDAGVHALSNLATFYFWAHDDVDGLIERLATPRDDGLLHVQTERVPFTVHARGNSRGKRYRYLLEDGARDAVSPSAYVWRIAPRLDVERMRAAAAHLEGTHDFTSFRAPRCSAASAVKTLAPVRIGGPFAVDDDVDGARRYVIEIAGTAFLRKMIRLLVGAIAEIGAGFTEPAKLGAILAARDRTRMGLVAPAGGLTLVEVGCSWPTDGSRRVRELAHLREEDDADDD